MGDTHAMYGRSRTTIDQFNGTFRTYLRPSTSRPGFSLSTRHTRYLLWVERHKVHTMMSFRVSPSLIALEGFRLVKLVARDDNGGWGARRSVYFVY